MNTTRRPFLLVFAGLAAMLGIQVWEIVLSGSIDSAISIGPPDLSPMSVVRDVLMVLAVALVVLAFPPTIAPPALEPTHRRFILGALAFAVVTTLMWLVTPDFYIRLGEEDGFIEVSQTLGMVGAAVLFQMIALNRRKAGDKSAFIFAQFVAIGFLLYAGEEISWGQRIFGFESTGAFLEVNEQQETTLHNFLTVPLDTVYYSMSIVLLSFVPLIWHLAGIKDKITWSKLDPLRIFIPSAWIALVIAPAAGNTYRFWNVLPTQAVVSMAALSIATLWFARAKGADRHLALAVIVVIVLEVLALLSLVGDFSLRNNTEYRESSIILGVFAYSYDLWRRIKDPVAAD